jgi:hypothetical protein
MHIFPIGTGTEMDPRMFSDAEEPEVPESYQLKLTDLCQSL